MINEIVTVYITTKNRRELLERALHSVLNQSYKNLDIIIVDDASTDDTNNFLKAIVEENERVRFFRNKESMGACFSRNVAIKNARGKYITGLDDDDVFHENRVEIMLKKFIESDYSCICSSVYLVEESGEKKRYKDKVGVISLNQLLTKNFIGNQVLTRTSYLQSLNGFDVSFPALQDYDMWVRLVEKYGDSFKLEKCLYLVHVDHNLPRITNSSKRNEGIRKFIKKHSNKMTKSQKLNHELNIKINANEKLSVVDFINFPTISCFLKISKRIMIHQSCTR